MAKKRLLGTAWVLFILVLLSTRWVCGLYARYAVEDTGGGSARAAAFVFCTQDKENSHYLDLGGIEKPGDSKTYTFTVTNQNGSTVSEVAEKVLLTVRLNGSMPLRCTISGEGNELLAVNLPPDASAAPVEKTESAGEFPAAQARTNTYTMTVTWPAEENDSRYASRSTVAEVLLTVAAEQTD